MFQALMAAAPQMASAAGGGPSSAEATATGNSYGGINIGDSAIKNRGRHNWQQYAATGRPQEITFGADMGYMQAVTLAGAALITFLILRRMK